MFKNNLALAIKVDGKVLKEIDGKVYLPFGSEYTIFLKNTSNKRCRVKISVDGDDILDGTRIIVDAKSTSEIKRFIRNGNLNVTYTRSVDGAFTNEIRYSLLKK